MQRKKSLRTQGGRLLVLALMLALVLVVPAQSARKNMPAKGEIFGWVLEGATVVDPGKTTQTQQGIMVTDYTIEAAAVGTGRAPLTAGLFRLKLTAFSPFKDMPGQKAGRWYVGGNWTITDEMADPKLVKVRYNPAVVRGTLKAALDFNPAAQPGTVTASVRVPRMAQGAGNGQGTFQGNELFEGTLQMSLKR